MKIYKDGCRSIFVVENCDTKIEQEITKMITQLTGSETTTKNISNLVPMENHEKLITAKNPKNINIVAVLKEKIQKEGYAGFIYSYDYLMQNYSVLDKKDVNAIQVYIRQYIAMLKNIKPETLDLKSLKGILKDGHTRFFKKPLSEIMNTYGIVSINDLLGYDKTILDMFYLACISTM